MRTGIRLLLATSLLSNMALGWVVAAGSAPGHITPKDAGVATATLASNAPGADDSGSKAGTLILIERAALIDAGRAADRYWQAAGDYELAYGEALLSARDKVRAALTDAFGSEAREDPLFRKYFRPMDPMFAFLSSDEQLAIERLKVDRDRQLQAAISGNARRATSIDGSSPISPQVARRVAQTYEENLARILETSRLFEFQLRESATAQQLRASRVEFTEPEFREAYRLLARLAGNASGIDEVAEVRDGLRDLLGSRRFALLWSSRDPVYSRVRDVLAKNGIDESSADAVYQVINDFQDRKMRAARQAGRGAGADAAGSDSIEHQERDAIARIVGERLADEVIRSRALEAFRMFRSQPQPGSH